MSLSVSVRTIRRKTTLPLYIIMKNNGSLVFLLIVHLANEALSTSYTDFLKGERSDFSKLNVMF